MVDGHDDTWQQHDLKKLGSVEEKAPVFPALVIGCGGSGTWVLRETKERVRRFLNVNPESHDESESRTPPIVQFLAMDTVPWNPSHRPLNRAEFLELGGFNAGKVVRAMRMSVDRHRQDPGRPIVYPETHAWWSSDLTPGLIHQGARQRRPIGRLAFFYSFRAFKAAFDAKRERLIRIAGIEETERAGHQVPARVRQPRIYIVSSLCGGTGSSFFLDVALWARHLFGENAYIVGVLAMPSVFVNELPTDVQKRRVQANAYAALQELEYFQNYAADDPNATVWYPGEAPLPLSAIGRPFNRIYLLESRNQDVYDNSMETLSKQEDVWALVAQQILLEIGTPLASRLWELDANLPDERLKTGRFLSFSSFANTAVLLPAEKLQGLAAISVARSALEWTLDGYEEDGQVRPLDDHGARRGELDQAVATLLAQCEASLGRDQRPRQARDAVRDQVHQLRNIVEAKYFLGQLAGEGAGIRRRIADCESQLAGARRAIGGGGGIGRWASRVLPRVPLIGTMLAMRLRRGRGAAQGRVRVGDLERMRDAWAGLAAAVQALANDVDAREQRLRGLLQALAQEEHKLIDGQTSVRRSSGSASPDRFFELYTEVLTHAEQLMMLVREGFMVREAFKGPRTDGWRPLLPPDKARPLVAGGRLPGQLLAVSERTSASGVPELHLDGIPRLDHNDSGLSFLTEQAESQIGRPFDGYHIADALVLYCPLERAGDVLRLAFDRCRPFWRFEAETGFDRSNLHQIRLVGRCAEAAGGQQGNVPRDPEAEKRRRTAQWAQLLANYESYEQVPTGDPQRIQASVVVHGLPAEYIEGIADYRHYATGFSDLHVFQRPPNEWPDLGPEEQPGGAQTRVVLYVVVALDDELATVLSWPVLALARAELAKQTNAQSVALFVAPPSDRVAPDEQARRHAAIYQAVRELAALLDPTDDQHLVRPWREDSRWSRLLDASEAGPPKRTRRLRCFDAAYFLDHENAGEATLSDQQVEDTVFTAVDALLRSEAGDVLAERLAPDADMFKVAPLGTMGAACWYLPVQEMLDLNASRLTAELLECGFLRPLDPSEEPPYADAADELNDEVRPLTALASLVDGLPVEVAWPEMEAARDRGRLGRIWDAGPRRLLRWRRGAEPEVSLPRLSVTGERARPQFDGPGNRDLPAPGWFARVEEFYHLGRVRINNAWADREEYRRVFIDPTHVGFPDVANAAIAEGWVTRILRNRNEWLQEVQHRIRQQTAANVARGSRGLLGSRRMLEQTVNELTGIQRRLTATAARPDPWPTDAPVFAGRIGQQWAGRPRAQAVAVRLFFGAGLLFQWLRFLAGELLGWPPDPVAYGIASAGLLVLVGLGVLGWRAVYRWRILRLRRQLVEIGVESHRRWLLETVWPFLCRLYDDQAPPADSVLSAAQNRYGRLVATIQQLHRVRYEEEETARTSTVPSSFVREALNSSEVRDRIYEQAGTTRGRVDELTRSPALLGLGPAGTPNTGVIEEIFRIMEDDDAGRERRPEDPDAAGESADPEARGYDSVAEFIHRELIRFSRRQFRAPRDTLVEPIVLESYANPTDLLEQARHRAKPLFRFAREELVDDADPSRELGVPSTLLLVHRVEESPTARAAVENYEAQPIEAQDPYSLTYLRTVHGLRPEHLTRLATYARAYRLQSEETKRALRLAEDQPTLTVPEEEPALEEELV